jgi:hypothetical protein
MRGSRLQGRFNLDYEAKQIYEAIQEDLQYPVGVEVDWFRWSSDWANDNMVIIKDDIYDVSSSKAGEGRRWMLPFNMPAVTAQLIKGGNEENERGFYTVDTLRIVINAGDAQRLLPTLITNPTQHIKDRVLYRGNVFVPQRVLPRGHFNYYFSVVTVECVQINSEELVNDPQFSQYSSQVNAPLPTPQHLGYGEGNFGTERYGL